MFGLFIHNLSKATDWQSKAHNFIVYYQRIFLFHCLILVTHPFLLSDSCLSIENSCPLWMRATSFLFGCLFVNLKLIQFSFLPFIFFLYSDPPDAHINILINIFYNEAYVRLLSLVFIICLLQLS